jgi:hypothetical protein
MKPYFIKQTGPDGVARIVPLWRESKKEVDAQLASWKRDYPYKYEFTPLPDRCVKKLLPGVELTNCFTSIEWPQTNKEKKR